MTADFQAPETPDLEIVAESNNFAVIIQRTLSTNFAVIIHT